MSKEYQFSPFGLAVHPWINKPDTKFANGGAGVFKVSLKLSGEEAAREKAKVKVAAEKAFEAYMADETKGGKLTKGEQKKWTVYYPYEDVEDDEGNPTGEVLFHFKQNASIRLRDGSEKAITIMVVDAKNNTMARPIFGGTELRVMYLPRAIPMTSGKQVGVRLDFSGVQVRKLPERTGGGPLPSFGAVEGYVDEPGGSAPGHEAPGEEDPY